MFYKTKGVHLNVILKTFFFHMSSHKNFHYISVLTEQFYFHVLLLRQ